MYNLNQIRKNVGDMDDSEILKGISAGPVVYMDGVNDLYLQEATKRKLDISESTIEHIQP